MTENSSRIFTGHRPLGYVSNGIPLVTRYITRRREHLIVTVAGRTFLTYGGNKLGLLSSSRIHPEDITALTADSYLVFVAAGKDVYAWRRGNELQRIYKGHEATVHILLPFGPHLISVDRQSLLKVWDIKTGDQYLEMTFNNDKFLVTTVCHPSTYLNKILVGSQQGRLQLWNFKTCKLVFTFKGWESAVRCLEQAPALDVVAIGLESGDIYLHNLKFDETVVKFKQDWGPVTGLSFRTDGNPIMVSGSPAGHVALWDLEQRKLSCQMRAVHQGEVSGVRCLPGEPLLLTSSPDNTLKQWIFDLPDGGGRLLRFREGHSAPPTKIRYYGSAGESVLSAGQDSSLRVFSTVADLLHRSLGHASFNRKLSKKHKSVEDPVRMPPIVEFTTETTRDKEWDNIAAIHRDLGVATTWSFGQQKMGSLQLLHDRFKQNLSLLEARASCICLTICGNFVLLGYSTGHVDRYNIQSGLLRGSYEHMAGIPAHKHTVRAVLTDALNQVAVTGDSKGWVKFWRFKKCSLISKVSLDGELSQMRLHRESGLIAAAMEDFSVKIIDVDTRLVVREFPGHDAAITDMTFSRDSRWLVTSSLDCTARVWDLPTGTCVDYVKFTAPATSIDLSPAGDTLATSHVDDLGIYLWTNKTLYEHVSLQPLPADAKPFPLSLPSHLHVELTDEVKEEVEMVEGEEEEVFASPEQLSDDLVTLANLPGSRWLNLLSLDVIKAKNKPLAPPKKPKAAPFFLPTVPGLEHKFDLSGLETAEDTNSKSLNLGFTNFTEFGKALGQATQENDLLAMLKSFMEKGPSAIDMEIRSLSPEGGGSVSLMCQFLDMLKAAIRSNANFEAVQAYLGLFLKVHGDTLVSDEEIVEGVRQIKELQENKWNSLQSDIENCLCLVSFFKSSIL